MMKVIENNVYIQQQLETGLKHFDDGDLLQAEAACWSMLEKDPNQADALHMLGLIAFEGGRSDIAEELISCAIVKSPQVGSFYNSLGKVYQKQGKSEDSMACFGKAITIDPDSADAYHHLGTLLYDQGEAGQACEALIRSLQLNPENAEAFNYLGAAFAKLGNLDAAIESYRCALQVDPSCVEACNNLGVVLYQQKKFDEAIDCYYQAIRAKRDYAEAYNNLGSLLKELGVIDEAIRNYEFAIQLKPDYADALYNVGNICYEQGNPADAIDFYLKAIESDPNSVKYYNNLGNSYLALGQLDEALACYQKVLASVPDDAKARYNKSFALLLKGEFIEGFKEYEWRHEAHNAKLPEFKQPLWNGTPLEGQTVLVYTEQGQGDSIQFIRYTKLIKERGGNVIVSCQPSLVRLFETCSGIDKLIPNGATLPEFDVHTPLMSLPHVFKTTLESIPSPDPYIFADKSLVKRWHDELKGLKGLKIGIVWQGNPEYSKDQFRSIPLKHFEPLSKIEGINLISLQRETGLDQLQELRETFGIKEISQLNETDWDYMDTAALMMNLDLVISSDTSVPHLAGALGVPVWVPLSWSPDWRWGLKGEDYPWYSSMKLFRQTEFGNWDNVFARIAEACKKML
jgi:tetratricopeptide (TPR) repeat protein